MKVYISADIEGIAGLVDWKETDQAEADYKPYSEQMTREVKAACEGAINAGAKEIWVKDAHDLGRNINIDELPKMVRLIRSWSEHPFCMMQELDASFDSAIMIGYHSGAGTDGNPLAHSFSSEKIANLRINDKLADEFLVNTYTAGYVNVPVVFVSGDEALCKTVKSFNNNIKTVATKKGIGNSVISIHPEEAITRTRAAVQEALDEGNRQLCKVNLPSKFKIEINYIKHAQAYQASFYPGVKQLNPNTVLFETDDYFEVLRMFSFLL